MRTFFILLFLFFVSLNIRAQTNPSVEDKVKAVFLYNFTRFIDWPDTSFSSKDAPLIIGIIGNDRFGTYLVDVVRGEKVDMHPIIVKHFSEVSEINSCHILYINSDEEGMVKSILDSLAGRSILTVNDISEFPQIGGMVR